MLEVQSLECVRDDRLLFSDLSFSVAEAEVLQIEGSNGCGKTSLLRIICGLRLAEAGQVLWRGERIQANHEDYYANMVYIGHLPCIKAELTVLENVRALLDEAAAKGVVRYGIHAQSEAMMTCIVPSIMTDDHVHFVDGASGGYTVAAQAIKG